MPYKIIKHSDGTYSVKNIVTGVYKAKKTTLKNAYAQIRLLEAIEKLGNK